MEYSTSINNLSGYKNTGKFACEKDGLYLVSTTVVLEMKGLEFSVCVNGNVYTRSYKYQQDNWGHSSTTIITIELQTIDTVWVETGGTSFTVRGGLYSMFNIIKVK